MGDEIVDVHLSDFVRRVAEHPSEGGVGLHEAAGPGVEEVDAVRGLLYDGPVTLLASAQLLLRPAPSNGRAQGARGGSECPDLRRRPLALHLALVEADEPPPLPFDEDRHDSYGEYTLLPKLGLLALREVASMTVDGLATGEEVHPTPEPGGPTRERLHVRLVYLAKDSRRRPLVTLGAPRLPILVGPAFEDVSAAGLRGLAEPP